MHEIQPRKFVNSSSGGPCLIPDFFANPATGISQGSDGGPNLSVNQGAVVTVTTWVLPLSTPTNYLKKFDISLLKCNFHLHSAKNTPIANACHKKGPKKVCGFTVLTRRYCF